MRLYVMSAKTGLNGVHIYKRGVSVSGIVGLINFVKKHIKFLTASADVIALMFAVFVSSFLKFDGSFLYPLWFVKYILYFLIADIAVTETVFLVKKLYSRMWQYFAVKDYGDLLFALMLSKAITFLVCTPIWINYKRSFLTWFVLFATIVSIFVFGIRVLILVIYKAWRKGYVEKDKVSCEKKKRVMIIGAGSAADRLLAEFKTGVEYYSRYDVVALIDDNRRKKNDILNGVKVYGGRESIVETVNKLEIDEIYFAVPSASEQNKKEILDICKQTNCVLKTLPDLSKFVDNGKVGVQLRKVDYTDLLGRPQIKPDLSDAFALLKDKTVLVTGGGGSIGSELVRQIAKSGVTKRVIIFDIAENGAYDIQQEIRRKYPETELKVLIGSVRDEQRLCEIFEEYHPDIVYHAAAHKHVPLMEDSPKEAVKNNCFGTYNLAKVSDRFGVKRFVMISTDKAVNPTNVMGATKRICEMIVQSFNKISETEFVCVRFGNVLGSNGSVIPLFKEQIEAGGPVTVTHPDIIRYFMLIPEAVSLVLKAGANAKGGEIFILDMGSPVKIRELAENLIRLSGYRVGEDIEIKYTGLRDGEKLYEELLIAEEGIRKTENDLIYIAKPVDIDSDKLFSKLSVIGENIENYSRIDVIEQIAELVPTFNIKNKEFNDAMNENKVSSVK